MKKTVSLILIFCLVFLLAACGNKNETDVPSDSMQAEAPIWTMEQTLDEFGDVTENSVSMIVGSFEGSFNNTATEGSPLTAVVSFTKKPGLNHYIASFDLKEYNNTSAVYSSGDPISFKMKVNDTIEQLDVTGTAPNGPILAGKEEYTWDGDYLFNTLYDGNDVRCIINIESSEYSFTLESANLPELCQTQNIGKGSNDLTCREVVKILLDDQGRNVPQACNWLQNNYETMELLDDASIKSALNGCFLKIWTSTSVGGKYIYNDNWFPDWNIVSYSFLEGTEQGKLSYNFGSEIEKQKMSNNLSQGVYLSAYKYYRLAGGSGLKNKLSVMDNTLITEAELNISGEIKTTFIKHQVRKISEDVFLLCLYIDSEGFVPNSILVRCNGETTEDIIATASSVDSVLLPKILE